MGWSLFPWVRSLLGCGLGSGIAVSEIADGEVNGQADEWRLLFTSHCFPRCPDCNGGDGMLTP
jgi:hypothetical protein